MPCPACASRSGTNACVLSSLTQIDSRCGLAPSVEKLRGIRRQDARAGRIRFDDQNIPVFFPGKSRQSGTVAIDRRWHKHTPATFDVDFPMRGEKMKQKTNKGR